MQTNLGINLRFGDVEVKSWFEEKALKVASVSNSFQSDYKISTSDQNNWWRCLSISGLNMGQSPVLREKLEFHLFLRKSLWFSKIIIVRGRLSNVDVILK